MGGFVRAGLLAALLLASCSAIPQQGDKPVFSPLDPGVRQLAFSMGMRSHDDPDYGRLEDQVLLAVDYCEPMELEHVRLEGGLHFAYDDASANQIGGQSVRVHERNVELSLGLNLAHLFGRMRPYIGLGGALQFVNLRGLDEQSDEVFQEDDTVPGGYLKVGLLFQVTSTSHVGFEARHFEGGQASFDGGDLDTSYDQFVFVLGTSFIDPWDL